MSQDKKRWVWVLALIPLLFLLLYLFLPRDRSQVKSHSAPQSLQPARAYERASAANAMLPHYLPLSAYRLPENRNPDQSTECLMTGKVKSDEGQPLPGATVSLYASGPADPNFEWPKPLLTEVCDYEGRYTIHMAAPLAKAAIGARKDGYATLQDTQDIEVPGTITKDYILRKAGACLEGLVLEGDKPIAKTRVFTTFPRVASSKDRSMTSAVSAFSDVRGRYSLQGLPEGLLDVFADPPGYQRKTVYVSVSSGPCGHLDFKVAPGTLISFLVKNKRGDPIQGAYAMTREEGSQFGKSTRTAKDENGNVESMLPPWGHSDSHGKYSVPQKLDR